MNKLTKDFRQKQSSVLFSAEPLKKYSYVVGSAGHHASHLLIHNIRVENNPVIVRIEIANSVSTGNHDKNQLKMHLKTIDKTNHIKLCLSPNFGETKISTLMSFGC